MITHGPAGDGPSPDETGSDPSGSLLCHGCGAHAETTQRWRWSVGTDERGITTMLCADCARASARGIEAKLDEGWW